MSYRSSALLSLVIAAFAPAVPAQGRHVFDVDTPNSSFTYSGTVMFSGLSGPIVGQPPSFDVSGVAALDVTSGATLTEGRILGPGTVLVLPTLNAIVPNPIPFLPALATIRVQSATFSLRSVDPMTLADASFPVQPNGAFTTSVVAELLSGTVTVSGLVNQTINLANTVTTPTSINGTLQAGADGLDVTVPLMSTFSFVDPLTNNGATLTINGAIRAADRALAADVAEISVGSGGTQTLTLSAGTSNAGNGYLLAGSASGTTPGLMAGMLLIPLNADGYLVTTASMPNTPPLGNSASTLSPLGIGTATFSIPPLPAGLAGLTLDHAYFTYTTNPLMLVSASNAVSVRLVP